MKVINWQTFSIANPLASSREAAVQSERSDRSCRICVRVHLTKNEITTGHRRDVRERKCTKSLRKVATVPQKFTSLSGLMKSSQFHLDVPGRVLSSLSQHSKLPIHSPSLPLVCSLHLNVTSRFLLWPHFDTRGQRAEVPPLSLGKLECVFQSLFGSRSNLLSLQLLRDKNKHPMELFSLCDQTELARC